MTHPHLQTRAGALVSTILLAGCASLGPQRPPAAAFVVLGEDGAPAARAITTAPACPSITIDGRTTTMAVRAPFGAIPLRGKDHSAGYHPDAKSTPVLSCETALPAGSTRVDVAGRPLPLPRADVKRIVVIGDTGCRLKGKEFQDCNDPQAYPFARVAASAAAWKPDLVVHVGDFHYREDPCPADRPGCAGSPYGYGWDAWNADFFAPGQALLAAAPWVLARGNHETCARGGQGWWRFLDAHRYDPAANCDDPSADERADYTDPYAVPLGGDAQLIVFDSANTNWKGFKPGDVRVERYADTWRKIDLLARRQRYNIAVDHHPLYAFGATRDAQTGAVTLFGGDAGLTQVFGALDPRLLPSTVDMLLSGHVHLWEQTSFATDHPTQFVAGFAGTAEDIVPLPKTPPAGQSPAPGATLDAMSSWIDGFGFMTMERTGPDTWHVVVHDRDGKTRNTCTVQGRRSTCAVPQV
ncbi:metallophosphoesterase family protein [Massilia putida]|uniref:metallophosphoesterase family protein n=1 Tax=Massilia putida TaxID=1141883 RepID=UPI0009526266|nr:metallophosphoesterase [Massilia putida]